MPDNALLRRAKIVCTLGPATATRDTLRSLMADFRSPFVPELPRFTGGAVGYLDYDTAEWFEPAVTLDDIERLFGRK